MIDQKEANTLLNNYLHETNLIKHAISVEAIMKELATELDRDIELWGYVGLLHDLDYEYTQDKPELHGLFTASILESLLPDKAINAIKAHNFIHTNQLPIYTIDKALIASDSLSGLIIATTLVMPKRKLKDVTVKNLKKRYKDKSFAKGCDRDKIALCEDIGIDLEKFFELSLNALNKIAQKLEL